jgi:uncharacterized protein YbjT (DUF2867 family)
MMGQHVLVTGATGYIGKRLIPVLIEQGVTVTCLIRNKQRCGYFEAMGAQVIVGDLLSEAEAPVLPPTITHAYFLVHAMSDYVQNLHDFEAQLAHCFVAMVSKTACRQIIYLSGLCNFSPLSPHLKSRMNVETILQASGIPTTVLRASIIIGSGSASFEIIRDLIEKLPIMIAPKWIVNRCQPISVHTVVRLLIAVQDHPECLNDCFDVGGPDVLTFKAMMAQYAAFRGLNRYILSVPVLTLRLSSLWLCLVASTNFSLSRYLVDSMQCDSVCADNRIQSIFPEIRQISYAESLARAFTRIEENMVVSSWKDSWHITKKKPLDVYMQVPEYGCLTDIQRVPVSDVDASLESFWCIGGANGWYYATWLWSIRGLLDKCIGGVGLRRGRTHPTMIHNGDALDFWRVIVANKADKRLLLYAEMKLPGQAWMEWRIVPEGEGYVLEQVATFRPNGLMGRLYWYALIVPHTYIFKGLARKIAAGYQPVLDNF